jgi:hypothetical protein
MRIGMGQLVSNSIPVTLVSGKVISDPMTQSPSPGDCLPYQCGADSSNGGALQWCSMWGQAGAKPCYSPECAPAAQWLGNCIQPAVAAPTAAVVPTTPAAPAPAPAIPVLTPQNIVQPLPDITAVVAPIPEQSCSFWCDLNTAIAANPMIAVAVLAGAAFLLWPKAAR